MKEIPLTQGKVAIVDDEDYERLNKFKWCATRSRDTWYAIKYKSLYMHREIMHAPKGVQVDHRNSDGLFNCKENLRLATNQQNAFNRRLPYKKNKLGIKGVCWHKKYKKFQAQIQVNGKQIYLGMFNVLGDADSAYRKAEEKYFGEFARTQ